jgi:plasmid maintenance system antidote protein VapI
LNSENSAVRLGFGIADVASVTNTLASEFGVSLENASELSSQVLDTAKATGLSVDEATKLTGQLRIIAGLTADQSENLIESTFQLARQAGVAPQQVLKDIAASSETVAKFTKGTGENLFEAAVAARQLGISVDSIAKAARSTLDFESSVAAELEASIMLGQNINLQRARQLALNKDLVGFQEEIKNQLGDIGDFNELGIFQQESLAKAVGMSVEEVARLVSGTEKLTVAGALSAGTFDDLSGQEALSRLSSLTGLFNQISKTLLNELGPVFEDILSNLVAFLGNEQNIQKITNTIRNLASVVGFLAQNLSIVGLLLGAAAGASFGLPGIIIGAVAGAGAGYALQNAGGGGSALPSMDTNFGGGGTTNNRSQADTQAIVNAINNINVSSTLTDRQIRVTLDNIGG